MNILQEDLHGMFGIDFLAPHDLRLEVEIKRYDEVVLNIKMSLAMDILFLRTVLQEHVENRTFGLLGVMLLFVLQLHVFIYLILDLIRIVDVNFRNGLAFKHFLRQIGCHGNLR